MPKVTRQEVLGPGPGAGGLAPAPGSGPDMQLVPVTVSAAGAGGPEALPTPSVCGGWGGIGTLPAWLGDQSSAFLVASFLSLPLGYSLQLSLPSSWDVNSVLEALW